ncbi:universal stress protein [Paraburkholderia phymatum]|uniref:UspA domain protein n=1 Tax=Paraburkholderia phymatum (strain DSM 17167 / CIP 108236 / LMG 21445 / STM815) TaxID=391038 RepID=B2JWG2_PARP8|nr:universal stress protein [Paraburkholderia phymatum]ACC75289.1 UspA domain protein [Paraburkholderia phymatum STM815]
MNPTQSDDISLALPRRVLIAVDSSTASRNALAYASSILPHGGEVRLVSVAENPHTLFPTGRHVRHALDSVRDRLLEDAAGALEQAKAFLAPRDVRIETEVVDLSKRGGVVVQTLVNAANAWQAELLVVGAHHHHGLARWVEGTVSEGLTKLLHCPLLVVPEGYSVENGHLPEKILFAVDGSPHAANALRFGVRFAAPDASLRAIYVIDRAVRLSDFVPIDALEDAFLDEGKHALAAAEPVLSRVSTRSSTALVKTRRTSDDVAHTIVREASNCHAQLIVMGTHGRRGISRWLFGSVAGRVAQLAQTPLLLVGT